MARLSKDNDLELLVNKMKKLHVKDTKVAAYLAHEKSELFKRSAKMNIVDYPNEFERLYYDIQRYEMTLPSAVSVYSVLQGCQFIKPETTNSRVTILELTYENMKKQLDLT